MTSTQILNNDNSGLMRELQKMNHDRRICQICNFHYQSKAKFAECDHCISCSFCGRVSMLAQIKRGREPVCYQSVQCNAKMKTGQDSMFLTFSITSKEQYWEFMQRASTFENSQKNLRDCQVTQCKGMVQNNTCTKCLQTYCPICQQFDHSVRIPCKKKVKIWDQLIKCPKCAFQWQKNGGCGHMTCRNCRSQFCEYCLEQWSTLHHACASEYIRKLKSKSNNGCCQIF